MSALRRALRDGQDGHRFIVNIPGRGYRFVASVDVSTVENDGYRPGVQATTSVVD
jgi:DNA-binding winged helix-turn-helix (wHTH) protein